MRPQRPLPGDECRADSHWLGDEIPASPQMALCRCGESAIKPVCDGGVRAVRLHRQEGPQAGARQARHLRRRPAHGLRQPRDLSALRLLHGPPVDRVPHRGRVRDAERRADGRDHPRGPRLPVGRAQLRDRRGRGPGAGRLGRPPGADDRGHQGRPLPDHRRAYRSPTRAARPSSAPPGSSLEHYALCRCGHSQNKPFCSGMHWYVDFKDPVLDPDREPTLFEWCGGLPALTRMTRIFYEKHVPEDPLLAPLFASMSPDHPQRVAQWLGEVFGGPKLYSENYGGYKRMISQHLGKGLTEERRARWVELISLSAQEAGLPSDPEFQAAFRVLHRMGITHRAGELPARRQASFGDADAEVVVGVRRNPRIAGVGAGKRGGCNRAEGRAARSRSDGVLRAAHQATVPRARPQVDEVRIRPLVSMTTSVQTLRGSWSGPRPERCRATARGRPNGSRPSRDGATAGWRPEQAGSSNSRCVHRPARAAMFIGGVLSLAFTGLQASPARRTLPMQGPPACRTAGSWCEQCPQAPASVITVRSLALRRAASMTRSVATASRGSTGGGPPSRSAVATSS